MKLTEQQIAELAAIFDDVIASDSVAVQSAFQRLALLSSLAREEKDEPGPFAMLLKRLDWAEHELKDLRRELQILQGKNSFSFSGDYTVDLSQNMGAAMSTPYVYGSADTINITPLTTNDITWIGNIDLSSIESVRVK